MNRIAAGRRLIVLLLVPFVITLSSCGSEAADEADAVVDLSAPISERDVDGARRSLDTARGLWQQQGISEYTFEIGVEAISMTSYKIADDMVVGSEVLIAGDPSFGTEDLPHTVSSLFDQVDKIIQEFELDPSLVLPDGECGWHFNIRFDTDLGYPTYYDTLGPCDDGVGVRASVVVAP